MANEMMQGKSLPVIETVDEMTPECRAALSNGCEEGGFADELSAEIY